MLVNWFESVVAQRIGQPPETCTLASECGRWVTVEKDGSVYGCDHFIYPQYRLGNIREHRLVDFAFSERQKKFGRDKGNLPAHCWQCPYCFACYCECPKNRFVKTPDGAPGLNYLCSGLRRFLAHVEPHLPGIIVRPRSIIT